jgi:hypothetical protein
MLKSEHKTRNVLEYRYRYIIDIQHTDIIMIIIDNNNNNINTFTTGKPQKDN